MSVRFWLPIILGLSNCPKPVYFNILKILKTNYSLYFLFKINFFFMFLVSFDTMISILKKIKKLF